VSDFLFRGTMYNRQLIALGIPEETRPLQLRLPRVEKVIELCTLMYGKGGMVSRIIYKKASYPITPLVPSFKGILADENSTDDIRNDRMIAVEDALENSLLLREHLIDIQVKRETTGNVAVYFYPSFDKVVSCTSEDCGQISNFLGGGFKLDDRMNVITPCRKCKKNKLILKDIPKTTMADMKRENLIILEPNGLRVKRNPVTGAMEVRYRPPKGIQRIIKVKDEFIISTTPQKFIDAIVKNKLIYFPPKDIFFFGGIPVSDLTIKKTLNVSHLTHYPRLLTALSDIMGYLTDKESDLAASIDNIIPAEILYPLSNGESFSPENIDLGPLKTALGEVYSRKSLTTGIGLSPIPLGKITMGDVKIGAAQFIQQRKRARLEELISSIGLAPELVMGGMQFNTTSVALRNIENEMYNDRRELQGYLNSFVFPHIRRSYGIPEMTMRFADLRSTDDAQRTRLMIELADRGQFSWAKIRSTLGEHSRPNIREIEEDVRHEASIIKLKQKESMMAQVEAEAEANALRMNMEAEMQAAGMGGGQGEEAPGSPAEQQAMAEQIIQQLQQLPGEEQQAMMAELQQGDPALFEIVMQMIGAAGPEQGTPGMEEAPPDNAADAGAANPNEHARQAVYQKAQMLNIPAEEIEEAVDLIMTILAMSEQEQQAALRGITEQYPEMKDVTTQLYMFAKSVLRSEENLQEPLPQQREQTRENPV